ncbi:hypothetical protein HYH02_002402 [Chlamydomonas schloesseri]|uniref:Zinc finger AN1 and C2H2 domain-containing stress-associated protein 16 n=1 Tax=Chlamydomonas schloesseri TaxID=2026947 RepID=A0A836BBP4_9CHLO|nr:hypothetical protein HYH02_002402 [Chlamydomonas schloesseri]|eukprot:KAG2453069.1 hypothetical protein HYH02_002402 [Chlamydomonas schloesseri]
MESGEEDLGQVLSIGEHCSVSHCGQVDFLPFKCDCCNRVFCLEHRSYAAHACPSSGSKESTVIVCPICAKSVRMTPGTDPNALFEQHTRTDCDPANYDRVHKKPRCPVAGCKTKLTTINRYRCKHCNQAICLKHRDPADHRCQEVQAASRQQRGGFFLSRASAAAAAISSGRSSGTASAASSRPPSAPRPAPAAASAGTATNGANTVSTGARRPSPQELHAAAARQYEDPENSLRGTASRRAAQAVPSQSQPQSRWPWQPTPLTTGTNASTNSNANPLVPPHRPEKCPQCGAAFETVARLIQHVEDFHPAQPATTSSGGATAGGAGAAGATAGGAAGFFSNPLRGLTATTIAGGAAPAGGGAFGGFGGAVGVQADASRPTAGGGGGGGGSSLLYSGAGSGAGADGREVYRCHLCSRTFNDPVMLVQHSEQCGAAAAAAGGRGGGSGANKDTCVLC